MTDFSCITITPLFSTTSLASPSVQVVLYQQSFIYLYCTLTKLVITKEMRFVADVYLCVLYVPFHALSSAVGDRISMVVRIYQK